MEEFSRTDVAAAERGMDQHLREILCRFGTDYWARYYSMFGSLGGNVIEDAVYLWLSYDTDGEKLHGDHDYVIHFEAGRLPVTKAFWSLTLYDEDFYIAKDFPLDRHVLNSFSGMALGEDGSLDIYLQADTPGADREHNWLPAPRETYFTLLRIYWPEGDILNGSWVQPDVRRVR